MTHPIDCPPVEHSLGRLHRAGWSIGDAAFRTEADELAWVVSGLNGENRLRVEARTAREAWWRAVEEAARLGMLGRSAGSLRRMYASFEDGGHQPRVREGDMICVGARRPRSVGHRGESTAAEGGPRRF